MTKDQASLVGMAEQSLGAAKLLKQSGYGAIAASRAYYVMFYAASAVLLEKNIRLKRHSAVIAAFGREFARTGLLPRELHKWIREAFIARNASDYQLDRDVPSRETDVHIDRAERFLKAIKEVLAGNTKDRKL